jgi:acetyl-CoA carboxylase carboxyl transferase subunit beta
MAAMESRVDVTVENRVAAPADDGKRHPNTCPRCHSHYRDDELEQTLRVCSQCDHHFPVRARERIAQLADRGTFVEEDAALRSADPLSFFDLRAYTDRLAEAEMATGLGDAIIAGAAAIERRPCELAVMDFAFMGGSMGSTVGEKFVRACERAAGRRVPLVCVTASGGARMQEGILSLMQLPKTVCAVDELRDARCAFISVMTHPTTAGVLASFASLGDVTISEPGALLAFTGPRVVQQTTREKLPEDFGLAESNARFGHVDAIVPRAELRPYVGRVLAMFTQAQ